MEFLLLIEDESSTPDLDLEELRNELFFDALDPSLSVPTDLSAAFLSKLDPGILILLPLMLLLPLAEPINNGDNSDNDLFTLLSFLI